MSMIRIGKNPKIIQIIKRYGEDIIYSGLYEREKDFCQHGVISTY